MGAVWRLIIGRDLVALGFLLVLCAFALAILFMQSATDIVTVLAPVVTLVGSLIGAAFGVQAGNEARATEARAREVAQQQSLVAAAYVPPEDAQEFLQAQAAIANPNSTDNGNPTWEE